jgi:uncharacterized protein (DUF983 family)
LYYFPTDPPYFLLVVGLFMGISCGAAFDATLKRNVKAWSADRENIRLENTGKLPLQLPFVGIASGVGMFLTSGLAIFGFPDWLAAALAIPLTLLTTLFLWIQLRGVFKELDRGGSAALDLDSWG